MEFQNGRATVDGRVRGWMDEISRTPARLVAVTHPAVIRAAIPIALEASPKSFWRIDIAPASRTVGAALSRPLDAALGSAVTG